VAGVAPLRGEQRILSKRHAHTGDALAVNAQKLCILCAVARGKLLRDRRVVGKAEVDESLLPVAQQRLQMVGGGITLRLAILRHDVADVKGLRAGGMDGVGHTVDEKIGDDARIKAARAEQDEVRLLDGAQRIGQRLRMLGQE